MFHICMGSFTEFIIVIVSKYCRLNSGKGSGGSGAEFGTYNYISTKVSFTVSVGTHVVLVALSIHAGF